MAYTGTLADRFIVHASEKVSQALVYDIETCRCFSMPYDLAKEITSNSCSKGYVSKVARFLQTKLKGDKAGESVLHSSPRELFALRLMVTNRCNFDCTYCYADGGSYGLPREDMTIAVAQKSLEFFLTNYSVVRQVSMFGGEPLLNMGVIKFVSEYVSKLPSSKRPKLSIVTNGYLLDGENLDLLKEFDFDIIVSIDGPKQVHDLQRTLRRDSTATYRGTFDRVNHNALTCIGSGHPISIEATYTSNHERQGISRHDLDKFLKKQYSAKSTIISDMIASELQSNDTSLVPAQDDDDNEIGAFFASDFTTPPEEIRALLWTYLTGSFSSSFCGAGMDRFAVNMNGDVYPCHLFISDKRFVLGNITHDCHLNTLELPSKNSSECRKCSYYPYCMGCTWSIMSGKRGCQKIKADVNTFLHGMLHLRLEEPQKYDDVIEKFSLYFNREDSIQSITTARSHESMKKA